MGSKSIAHEAEGQSTIDSETMRVRGIIVLVKSNQLVKNIKTKQLQLAKRDSAAIVLVFKAGTSCYQWAMTLCLVVAQPIRMEGGVRVCGDAVLLDFWCGFAVIFILSCGITVLQNQAVCGNQKFSGNFNAVCGFLMLFCAVFICISVRFCGIRTPLTLPSKCSIDNRPLVGFY